ncbi:MAG: hypothetical protein JW910_19015, partial [Anaerolineae bacterium]|nr:hypothetical protein [Anaerolineae bacterium]
MRDSTKEPTVRMRSVSPPTEPVGVTKVNSSLRRRQKRRQRRQTGAPRSGGTASALIKWGLLAVIGLVIIGMIASPLVYRSLRPEYRERIKHYLPFMSIFDPQREYTADTLPTVAPAGDGGSAMDLLLGPGAGAPTEASGGAGAAYPGIDATPNEDGVIIITATPTIGPTMQPTEGITATTQPTQALPTPTWTPLP